MSSTPLIVDIEFQIDASGSLLVAMEIKNTLDRDIAQWSLHFDLPKEIFAGQHTRLHSQVGSHVILVARKSSLLAAGERHTLHFSGHSAIIQRLSDLPCGIYINSGCDNMEVSIGRHNLAEISGPGTTPHYSSPPHSNYCAETTPDYTLLNTPHNPADSTGQINPIIPRPATVHCKSGSFSTTVLCYHDAEEAQDAIAWLKHTLPTGMTRPSPAGEFAQLQFKLDDSLDSESYQLQIGAQAIIASAGDSAGFFYAIISLCQLLQASPENAIVLPQILIDDRPRFGYRGLMLDCARHFHSKDVLLELLDHMARYKLNRFHWHLTDDEGWRIEIKAFPALTRLGAWRGHGETLEPQFGSGPERYGGYYSHQDIREIIAYAQQRHIVVVPEIDIPGHCRAALKSLPELLVEEEDQSQYVSAQLYRDNVLNPALSGTYHFLHTVLDEVAELFPGPYIHIGADEVPHGVWEKSPACQAFMKKHNYDNANELQSHLLRNLQNHLKQKGRQLVGWEEAVRGNKLNQSAILGAWSELATTTAIAEAGYRVIACPAPYAYLDLAWDSDINEPGFHWAGTSNLETCYAFEPYQDDASVRARQNIIGVQALLWSELISSPQRLEYMLFPRLLAIAETAWSPRQGKDWASFQTRLAAQLKKLDQLGVAHHDFCEDNSHIAAASRSA